MNIDLQTYLDNHPEIQLSSITFDGYFFPKAGIFRINNEMLVIKYAESFNLNNIHHLDTYFYNKSLNAWESTNEGHILELFESVTPCPKALN